jgi:hypothetical protein
VLRAGARGGDSLLGDIHEVSSVGAHSSAPIPRLSAIAPAFPSFARRPFPRRNPRASTVRVACVHSTCEIIFVSLPDLFHLCRLSHPLLAPPPPPVTQRPRGRALQWHIHRKTLRAPSPLATPRALPPASRTIFGCMTMTTTTVVTVVPQAAEDALRLLDLERCTRCVDAKDRRRCAARVHAARRRSVCRRVSERKDLRAPRTRARCNRRACISGGASGRGSTAAPQHRPPAVATSEAEADFAAAEAAGSGGGGGREWWRQRRRSLGLYLLGRWSGAAGISTSV